MEYGTDFGRESERPFSGLHAARIGAGVSPADIVDAVARDVGRPVIPTRLQGHLLPNPLQA
jgi:hypothetical protein